MSTVLDPRAAFWREALDYALDIAGVFDALTSEQKAAVAVQLAGWQENESQWFGPTPPDPEDRQHADALAARDATLEHETTWRDERIRDLEGTVSSLRYRLSLAKQGARS